MKAKHVKVTEASGGSWERAWEYEHLLRVVNGGILLAWSDIIGIKL